MTPFVFDTLSASKQLREAGMSEGVAEAVVSVFQHASAMPDISHLATKADLQALGSALTADIDALKLTNKADLDAHLQATKADFDMLKLATKADLDAHRLATKADLDAHRLATRADMDDMATKVDLDALKADVADVRLEIANLRADLYGVIRQQGWMLLGGVAMLLTISTAVGRAIG